MAALVVDRAGGRTDGETVAEGVLETVEASSFWGSAWKRRSCGNQAEIIGTYTGSVPGRLGLWLSHRYTHNMLVDVCSSQHHKLARMCWVVNTKTRQGTVQQEAGTKVEKYKNLVSLDSPAHRTPDFRHRRP